MRSASPASLRTSSSMICADFAMPEGDTAAPGCSVVPSRRRVADWILMIPSGFLISCTRVLAASPSWTSSRLLICSSRSLTLWEYRYTRRAQSADATMEAIEAPAMRAVRACSTPLLEYSNQRKFGSTGTIMPPPSMRISGSPGRAFPATRGSPEFGGPPW